MCTVRASRVDRADRCGIAPLGRVGLVEEQRGAQPALGAVESQERAARCRREGSAIVHSDAHAVRALQPTCSLQ